MLDRKTIFSILIDARGLIVDKKVEMNDWLEFVKGLMAADEGKGVLLRKIVYMKMSRSPYG